MDLRVVPLTPELWPAFADLFGPRGACAGCWCTYFRLPPKVRQANDGEANAAVMRARVEAGPPPGLLALDGERAVGWMQVGPRADVPEFNRPTRASAPLEDGPADDPRVWAISCFFLRSSARRRGLTHQLVAAGIERARSEGARLLEACPMTLSRDSRSIGLYVGSARVFLKAGFEVVAERKPGRPLVRLALGMD